MTRRPSPTPFLLGTTLLGVLALAPASLAAGPAQGGDSTPEPPRGTIEQRQTITTLRDVGTAMFVWYQDQVERQGIHGSGKHESDPSPTQVDVAAVPVISAKDLEKVLAPLYIGCVPAKDGWGHPIEYRLNTRDLQARQIMGIRSGGADGRLSGTGYEIGSFTPDDTAADLVWVDGFFARWPQGPKKDEGATR